MISSEKKVKYMFRTKSRCRKPKEKLPNSLKSRIREFTWVEDGIRTHDFQNHNLTL